MPKDSQRNTKETASVTCSSNSSAILQFDDDTDPSLLAEVSGREDFTSVIANDRCTSITIKERKPSSDLELSKQKALSVEGVVEANLKVGEADLSVFSYNSGDIKDPIAVCHPGKSDSLVTMKIQQPQIGLQVSSSNIASADCFVGGDDTEHDHQFLGP
ncbi:hypothetical protein Nepgr_017339 [Nepenthes gracilis]|uniref:Uncharacterized protein n=1 Tax=Nepenthes gracilis TaxID=150966 RepID=A0AAD3SP93_NEPGR|nr:hypothetical protein Nepgr_017339 [Nepenthes gracilis]